MRIKLDNDTASNIIMWNKSKNSLQYYDKYFFNNENTNVTTLVLVYYFSKTQSDWEQTGNFVTVSA